MLIKARQEKKEVNLKNKNQFFMLSIITLWLNLTITKIKIKRMLMKEKIDKIIRKITMIMGKIKNKLIPKRTLKHKLLTMTMNILLEWNDNAFRQLKKEYTKVKNNSRKVPKIKKILKPQKIKCQDILKHQTKTKQVLVILLFQVQWVTIFRVQNCYQTLQIL